MNTELRKRLEEAAELCQQYQEIYGGNFATAYMKGYTDGYKEAINVAKEWLKENTFTATSGHICYRHYGHQKDILADFETAMNKLWEEKK